MGLFKNIFKAIPIVGDAISAADSKKATKKASAAQIAQINNAIGGLNANYDTTAARFDPFIDAGEDALGGLRGLVGLNGADQQKTSIDALKGSPLFQSLFNTGRDSILAAGSATGGLRGGNINDALYDNGRDTLAQVIQQQLANLGGISSQGLSATGGLANLGAANAQSIAGLTTGIGNAQAGSILGQQAIDNKLYSGLRQTTGSIITGGLGGGAGGLGSLFSQLGGGGGLQGNFPGITGASSQPFNLGNINTSALTQKVSF